MDILKSLIEIPTVQQWSMVGLIGVLCFVLATIILIRVFKSLERFGGHMTVTLVWMFSSLATAMLLIALLLVSWFYGYRELLSANWIYLVAGLLMLLISLANFMVVNAVVKDLDKRMAIGSIRPL